VRSGSSELVEALDLHDGQIESSVRDPLPEMTKREWLLKAHAELVHDGDDPSQIYQVDREKRLGKGGFGEVFLGVDLRTGEKVAIKQMQINQKNKMEYLLIETDLHARVSQHPNVVQFLDAFLLRDKLEFWVVLEFVGGGPLNEFKHLPAFKEQHIAHCVPEDHEILTNRGFLDLDAYEAAAAADPTLLVASYNVASKALVFEKPNKLVLFEARTRQLVELSNADEMMHVWSADSDSHGLKARRSNGVSMLVTKEHDVFAQLGNASVEKNGSLMPDGSAAAHAKIQAGDLLQPTKTYNTVCQLAVAEAGVQKETVPDVCDELGLRTPHQRALFYEIYGFWLGDGTLKYHGPNAGYVVRFAQVKEADNDWLAASLSELDVQYTKSAVSKAGQVQITIQSDAWNRCFAAEYKHAADFVNEGDIDDIDADGVVDDDVDVSPAQSSKRKRADVSSEGADAVDALSNLKKFATFCEATDRHTATALRLQRVRDAVELTNDAIVAPPARAAAVAPVDAEGRAFDSVSTAERLVHAARGHQERQVVRAWVWRLGAASLRHVLAGLLRADGNVDQRAIYTSSARFRDEIQRVCLMAGYTAHFRCVYKGVDAAGRSSPLATRGRCALPSPTARPLARRRASRTSSRRAARSASAEPSVHRPRVVLQHAVGLHLGPPRVQGRARRRDQGEPAADHWKLRPEKRPSSASLERNVWLKRACDPSGMVPLIQTLRDGGTGSGGCVIQ
jgi:hypothetical protein